ncbi:glutamine-rich protein 2 [Camelus bactrianus]|uniref:Glutamine-rich protein 2 n=1 Tax=Camelus bactrianus TaxID=9837 RepID=A0AC58NKL8_CAMBA
MLPATAAPSVSLRELADLAIGTPEVGAVNFTALHTLIVAMLKNLNLEKVRIDFQSLLPEQSSSLESAGPPSSTSKLAVPKERRRSSVGRAQPQALESQVKDLGGQVHDLSRQLKTMGSQVQAIVAHVQHLTGQAGTLDENARDWLEAKEMALLMQGKAKKEATKTRKDSQPVPQGMELLQEVMEDMKILKEAQKKAKEFPELQPEKMLQRIDELEKITRDQDELLELITRKLSMMPASEDATMVTWEELEQAITDGWKGSQMVNKLLISFLFLHQVSESSNGLPKHKAQASITSNDTIPSGAFTKHPSIDQTMESASGFSTDKTLSGTSIIEYPSDRVTGRERSRGPSATGSLSRDQHSRARDEAGLAKPHHPSVSQFRAESDHRGTREQDGLAHLRREEREAHLGPFHQDVSSASLARDRHHHLYLDQHGRAYVSQGQVYASPEQYGFGPLGVDQLASRHPSIYPHGVVPFNVGQLGVVPPRMDEQELVLPGTVQSDIVPPLVPGRDQQGLELPSTDQPGTVPLRTYKPGVILPGTEQRGLKQPGMDETGMVPLGMDEHGYVPLGIDQHGFVLQRMDQQGLVSPGLIKVAADQQGFVQPNLETSGFIQPGAGQPGLVQPGAGQPDFVQPGTGQPGLLHPGAGQPGLVQPGAGQPALVQVGAGQPALVQAGVGQPDFVQPGADQPGLVQPGADRPGLVQPGVGQPGLVQPGVDQPGLVKPGLVQPGAGQPGLVQAGVGQPGLVQPGAGQPDFVQPGTGQPGLLQPGAGQPGLVQAGVGQPGLVQPGAGQPGLVLPGAGQPGTYQHGLVQSGAGQPGLVQPGAGQPGLVLPGAGQPGAGQPGLVQPGAGQPGLVQPGAGQPGLVLPGAGQPGTYQHGLVQSGVGQPGLVLPGAGQPGLVQPGAGQPGLVQPGVGQPGLVQPGAGQPGLVQPGVGQPGLVQPGAGQPGLVQPGAGQPGTYQHGLVQSGAGQPGLVLPGAGQPGLVQPGMYQHGLVQPGVDQPGLVQPGAGQPGLVQPGAGQPGLVQPGAGQPGLVQAGAGQPGLVQPDAGHVQSGVDQHDLLQPGTGPQSFFQPGVSMPSLLPPGLAQPSAYMSSLVQPGAYPRGLVQPGAYPRGFMQPGIDQRAWVQPVIEQHWLRQPGIDQGLTPLGTELHGFSTSHADRRSFISPYPYQHGMLPPGRDQYSQVSPLLSKSQGLASPARDQEGLVPTETYRQGLMHPDPDQPGPAPSSTGVGSAQQDQGRLETSAPHQRGPGYQGIDQHVQVDLNPDQTYDSSRPPVSVQTSPTQQAPYLRSTQSLDYFHQGSSDRSDIQSERHDSLDKLAPSFPMAVETFRLMGELIGLYMELKENMKDLDEEQAGQTDLEKIQYLLSLMVKKTIPADLLEQLKTLKTLTKEIQQEKAKLDRMNRILEGDGKQEIGKEVKAGQLSLQLGILRVTVADIEKELAELRESQERGKVSMEHSVSEASLYLQDQLDKLRAIIESMLTSSSTLLSMSMAPQKAPTLLAPGQIDPEAACPACSLDLSHQVSTLVQRYEQLQDMVNNLVASRPSKKSKLQSQDEELLGHIQSAILQVQGDCEKLTVTTSSLIKDHQQKQKDIDVLYQGLEKLEREKANREHLEMEIDMKADKSALAAKVSRVQFDATTEQLNHMMQGLVAKMSGQEQDWQKMLDKLLGEMDSKLDRLELDPVKQALEDRWKSLRQQLKERSPLYQADEAAAMRRQLLAHFHCLSCDRPLETPVTGQAIPVTPVGPGLPGHRSVRPYTVFELEQVRQQSRSLKLGSAAFPRGDLAQMERSVGRLHSMHSKMLTDIEKVQIHFGGSVKASSQMIRELLQAQCLRSPCYRRQPDMADHTYSPVSRHCGGSHTLTYPYRRSRLQHPLQGLYPPEEVQIAMKHDEVDILGLDGHIYKGRMDTRLPGILSKENSGITKHKAKQSRPHVRQQRSLSDSSHLPSRPQSAQMLAGNNSAPPQQRKDRPVSSEGRLSQPNMALLPSPSEKADLPAGLEMHLDVPPGEGLEEPTRGPRSSTTHLAEL